MRPRKRSRTVTCTAQVVTNTDVDLRGKRVTIAGKIAGYWAKANLAGRIKQLGGELTESFDRTADIVVIASKAKGFRKRIAKMNAVEITEQQLEEIVAERPQPKPAKPPPKADKDSFRNALVTSGDGVGRRNALVEAICDHVERGFDVIMDASRDAVRALDPNAEPQTLLVWIAWSEASVFVVPRDVPDWLKRDLKLVDKMVLYYEVGTELKSYGAAMRLLVATGDPPQRVWDKMRGDLDGFEESGLNSVEDLVVLGSPLAEHRVRSVAELNFPIDRLVVVNDHIPW